MKKFINLLPHFFVWSYILFTMPFYLQEGENFFTNLINPAFVLINILTFYFNYLFILPRLVRLRNPFKVILCILIPFAFFIFLKVSLIEYFLIDVLKYKKPEYAFDGGYSYIIFESFINATLPILMSGFIWFIVYAFKNEKEKQQLLEQKNEAEMSLLKSQINPHFIFNTLNNIYSLVNQKSDKSLDAIEKLGDLLRFSSNEIKKDFTSLNHEIQYVKNFIELEKLRITKPENIIFEDNIQDKHLKITPMILIPFVENAFKHGNLKDFPLNILIETKGDQLHFYQKNKISTKEKDKSSGIGIYNVKKRLSIVYPEKHSLKISNENGFYEVNLYIELD